MASSQLKKNERESELRSVISLRVLLKWEKGSDERNVLSNPHLKNGETLEKRERESDKGSTFFAAAAVGCGERRDDFALRKY
jgi:hypothetical protein